MRGNRKHFPKEELLPDKRLKGGESDSIATDVITLSKWKDRRVKAVLIGSTRHSILEQSINDGTKKTVGCPKSIAVYNTNMGGVDLFD
ncbi:carbohydrate binding domain containing protein [Holotrichia oblita]|uniref:Carbohydrate binding domain containing protein n=1 Tax=Holotrichia oblita TaxID=644536 RepID=A0ACB9T240_HOLOL|nr:carbohydrate binding domain containing protein [Holotrichia oblita]